VLAGSAVPRGVDKEIAKPNITSLPILAVDVLKNLKRSYNSLVIVFHNSFVIVIRIRHVVRNS
jgi:hypothetical protein